MGICHPVRWPPALQEKPRREAGAQAQEQFRHTAGANTPDMACRRHPVPYSPAGTARADNSDNDGILKRDGADVLLRHSRDGGRKRRDSRNRLLALTPRW